MHFALFDTDSYDPVNIRQKRVNTSYNGVHYVVKKNLIRPICARVLNRQRALIAKKLNINPRTLYKRRDLEYKNKLKLFLIIFERTAVTVGVYGFVVFKLICVKA